MFPIDILHLEKKYFFFAFRDVAKFMLHELHGKPCARIVDLYFGKTFHNHSSSVPGNFTSAKTCTHRKIEEYVFQNEGNAL